MKLLILFLSLAFTSVYSYNHYSWLHDNERRSEMKNPLKLFGKCISDSECEFNQYCDHIGITPLGSCKIGAADKEKCALDRYCRSKNCYMFKCMPREKQRDGPCYEADHTQCHSEQYCSHVKDKVYICKNRKCHGSCAKDAHCLTNNCRFFRCKRPSIGCAN